MGKQRSRTSKTLQCSVCGDYASVHKHYGSTAHVCFSCRAFFRRIGKMNKYPNATSCNSVLTNIGSCPITKKSRAFCGYCRYQKCVQVGMKRDFVMTSEDVEEMKLKADEVKKTGIPSKHLVPTSYQLRTKSTPTENVVQSETSTSDNNEFQDLLEMPTEMSLDEWMNNVDVEQFLLNA